jgi:hypothetical protein
MCAGDCVDTPNQYTQHSATVCRTLASGDADAIASVLAFVPDYKLVDYRYAKSIAAN